MKPFRESDLIAYHLQELSPRRARALEQALQTDPALAAESEAYATMLRSFKEGGCLDVDEEIVERNWQALWPKLPAPPVRPTLFSRWLVPALAGVGLAIAGTSVFITSHPGPATKSTSSKVLPNDSAPPPDSVGSPSATNAMTGNPDAERRGALHERVPRATARTSSQGPQLEGQTPRIMASGSRDPGPAPPLLRYIPLAPVPFPFTAGPSSFPITVGPETSLEVPGNKVSKRKQEHTFGERGRSMDVTLAVGGVLIGTSDVSSNGVTLSQGATRAVSAVGSFHQQLRPALGYRLAVSYTRPDFLYGYRSASSSGFQVNIPGRIYEVSGTYVVQGPHRGHVSTSAEAGGGLMAFLPSDTSSDASDNFHGAAVVGVSADFDLTKNLAIHTGYRLQVFKGPDFQSSGAVAPVPIISTTLFSNEPVVGITYRFSRK